MTPQKKINFLFFLLLWMAACTSCQSSGSNAKSSPQNIPLQVLATSDNSLLATFHVEIADEPSGRSMGLMYRQELAPDAGMLFIFDAPTTTSFWMRNTPLPLDIIFIAEDQRILNIAEGAPFSDTPIAAAAAFRYVLEINQGRATELGIHAGDRIEFSLP